MRASIRGGGSGDSGKCTIEVDVDGVADVEVRGDTGWVRTLQGQPATWRRFECTSVVPRNPVDFRFRGIDGRGRVNLIRDPNNGGTAVVRIEDTQGGREGYTFDLEWRGGNGAYSNAPLSRNDPYYRNDPSYRNDPYSPNTRRVDPNYDPNYRDYPNSRSRAAYAYDMSQAVGSCEQEVRARASRDYRVRNPRFTATRMDDRPGARDRVVGLFEGYRGEQYEFACSVNTNNGRVRDVDIRRR